jgi:alkylated DNA repair protein alkB family protein 6
MVAVPLPEFLSSIGNKMANQHKIFDGVPPNHVLINEYNPGGGIMPHEDVCDTIMFSHFP